MPRRRGRPGLMGTMARTAVVAGTATAVVGAVGGNKQAKQQAAAGQQQAAAAQQQQAAGQMAQMQSELDQLKAADAAKAQQAAVDQAVAQALAAQQQTAPAAGTASEDPMAQLQKLVDMKAQGLLSDEEFAAMKAKLLA